MWQLIWFLYTGPTCKCLFQSVLKYPFPLEVLYLYSDTNESYRETNRQKSSKSRIRNTMKLFHHSMIIWRTKTFSSCGDNIFPSKFLWNQIKRSSQPRELSIKQLSHDSNVSSNHTVINVYKNLKSMKFIQKCQQQKLETIVVS